MNEKFMLIYGVSFPDYARAEIREKYKEVILKNVKKTNRESVIDYLRKHAENNVILFGKIDVYFLRKFDVLIKENDLMDKVFILDENYDLIKWEVK